MLLSGINAIKMLMVKVHLTGKYLSVFSNQLNFFLPRWIIPDHTCLIQSSSKTIESDNFINVFTILFARAVYDTRLVVLRCLVGSKLDFSYSLTGCFSMAKEPSLPYYLPIVAGRIFGFILSPRVLRLCIISLVQDLNSCHRVHSLQR